jgi:hypothetical protein
LSKVNPAFVSPNLTSQRHSSPNIRVKAPVLLNYTKFEEGFTIMTLDNHIFISYRSKDIEKAKNIQNKLENSGFSTWLDVDKLPKNNDIWHREIDKAIKIAKAMVVILTKEACLSRFVTNEWDIDIREGIPIFLCEFEDVNLRKKYQNNPFAKLSDPFRRVRRANGAKRNELVPEARN